MQRMILFEKFIYRLHRARLISAFGAAAGEDDADPFVLRQQVLSIRLTCRRDRKLRRLVQLEPLHWLSADDAIDDRRQRPTQQNAGQRYGDDQQCRDKTSNDRVFGTNAKYRSKWN